MSLFKLDLTKRKRPGALLGLALDGSRLEGVVLRRTNGSMQKEQSFSVALSLDPMTNDPELVGREIRNQLDAAGVRERHCVLGLPLKWALITHTKLPDLPEADVASFLQIETERGFPCDVTTLLVATSQYQAASGEKHATMIGVPRTHLSRLEQVLRAAQLKPMSLTLGITALQPADTQKPDGVLALVVGESNVGLQVTCGGGVVALRALEGALEIEGGAPQLHADLVAREARITLGQLPAEFRETVRRVRIFGSRELAQELAEEIRLRFEPMGLKVELVTAYSSTDFGVFLPSGAAVSPAFSLAAGCLVERDTAFEFLPPKITALQQMVARYSSGTLQRAGVAAGVVVFVVLMMFLVQQWQLWRLRSKWADMKPQVYELEDMQQKIRLYRPWFDESVRNLSILRQLAEAFPEDGMVSAKSVEIRSQNQSVVTCSGTARDNQALLRMMDKLRGAPCVGDLKVDQIRGKTPMQFTFDFHWNEGGKNEN